MKKDRSRLAILVSLLVLIAVVAFVVFGMFGKTTKPMPTSSGYYTGPMANKNDPNKFVTDDGRVVPMPDGARPPGVTPTKPTSPLGGGPKGTTSDK